jgi:hypothetical protein
LNPPDRAQQKHQGNRPHVERPAYRQKLIGRGARRNGSTRGAVGSGHKFISAAAR